jgi:hypothetical protein
LKLAVPNRQESDDTYSPAGSKSGVYAEISISMVSQHLGQKRWKEPFMNCVACGKANADSVTFCEFCGARLRSGGASTSEPQVVRTPPPPSAAEVAQMGKSILSSLTLGEKFVCAGAIAATVGFFLPWFSSPDLGELGSLLGQIGAGGLNKVSLSGLDAAKLIGAVYFILLAAIASGVLFYFSRKAASAQKLLIGGFQVMIGSLFGPVVIGALFFVPMIQSVAGAGFWLLGLGFCSIAAGGLITIGALGKAAR